MFDYKGVDTNNQLYTGTSGLQIPIPKRDFPEKFQQLSRLGYYATLFNSIEINSSFYKLPIGKTLAKWATEVPGNFKFTFKLWRDATHNKGIAFKPDDVERFMRAIDHVGTKKGSLLVQFPASIQVSARYEFEQLINAIRLNDPEKQWDVAVEFRHRSWYQDNIYDLLQRYGMSLVIHDMPASASPLIAIRDNLVYLRFHGPDGGYKGSYTDDFLYEYAQYINEWQAEGRTVYAYFNNTMGNALANVQLLNKYLSA